MALKEEFQVGDRRYWIEVSAGPEPDTRLIRIDSRDGLPAVEIQARILGSSGRRRTFELDSRIEDLLLQTEQGRTLIERQGLTYEVRKLSSRDRLQSVGPGTTDAGLVVLTARMPGKIVRLLCEPGQDVSEGDGLIVIEAMKMQNEIRSPKTGQLLRYLVEAGANVNAGDPLCEVE
ncbi:MAG: biotin/lipoyl-containing protein [Acidobacteriota bacterium]